MANVKFYTGSNTLPTTFTEGALYFTTSGDVYYDRVGGTSVANDRIKITNHIADWAQNSTTGAGYVQNRTHWKEIGTPTPMIYYGSRQLSEAFNWYVGSGDAD